MARVLRPKRGDTAWRIIFILGVIAGAGTMFFAGIGRQDYSIPADRALWIFAIAGLLIGFGTSLGGYPRLDNMGDFNGRVGKDCLRRRLPSPVRWLTAPSR